MRDLKYYRDQIDKTDDEILRLFKERMDIALQIAGYKNEAGLPILDSSREQEKITDIIGKASDDIRPHARKLYSTLFELSRAHQANVVKPNKKKLLVINGPNLNMLGIREPEIYGEKTYSDLVHYIRTVCEGLDVDVEITQSNHEGVIIETIQHAHGKYDGLVINPAAYTHTSIAIMDALKSVDIPAVEVHLSDLSKREEFRWNSYTAFACETTFAGFGFEGYKKAIEYLINRKKEKF